jgi:hypothetical protein
MPRSPALTKSTNELAEYFGATTDATFIDKTWAIKKFAKDTNRNLIASGSANKDQLDYYRGVETAANLVSGISHAENISNLVNGSLSFTEFEIANHDNTSYKDQFKFYKINATAEGPQQITEITPSPPWNQKDDVIYAINVFNPYLGPMTRDTGAIEVFANAMPTIELSKCVPYLSIDVISLYKTEKTAPPMSLIGFLNPSGLSSVDISMINGQKEKVSSEQMNLGDGYRAGMELFLMPQTLSSIGNNGERFVPVIDNMRPLMSLKNLSMSTKMQGGTILFTSGRLELVLHDRSRLRDIAPFVRLDLYGTTFLDISYGWSHPNGDINSNNSFGKFLNSLKVERRYRISNSTFAFEEGGQVNITLSIQTVGSIDLLYLPVRNIPSIGQLTQTFEKLIQKINDIKSRTNLPIPDMNRYDFITGIQDRSSLLKLVGDADFRKKINDIESKSPADIKDIIDEMIGTPGGSTGRLDTVKNDVITGYKTILNRCPDFFTRDEKSISSEFNDRQFNIMKQIYDTASPSTIIDEYKKKFVSYGDIFLQYITIPIKESKYYDEVQVIFYPFNSYAGLVHDLPISCFPIDKNRFEKMIGKMAESTPEITARMLLNTINQWFTGFLADKSYLLADSYDTSKDDVTVEYTTAVKENIETHPESIQKKLEDRCISAGIPEAKLVPGNVQIHVEGCKLYDTAGNPIVDGGKSKTLIKIHVYDAACDPHNTLTDIIKSAKDNELDLFRIPISNYNSSQNGANKDLAIAAIKLGLESGAFEVVDLSSNTVSTNFENLQQALINPNVYIRNKLDFDSLKKFISAGMPTITYGSSTSIVTNASLSSDSSSALSNLLLQRAWSEPATTSAENVGTGPPMQVMPAQLNISTIGCPLFYPMQRFFVDFGTGTSIDNVYNVISVDDKIGKDGFTSDVKLQYGEGYATYRSLDQNLRMMSLYIQKEANTERSIQIKSPTPITRSAPSIEFMHNWLHEILVKALVPAYETKIEVEERIRVEVEKVQAKVEAKIQEKLADARAKAEALAAPIIKAAETVKKVEEEVQYKIEQAQYYAAQIAYYTALLASIPQIAAQLGPEAAAALTAEVQAALDDAEAQAKRNKENE